MRPPILVPMLLALCAIAACRTSPTSTPGEAAAVAAAHGQAIADGVVLIPGTFVSGRQPDGNSIVLRGRDGLVVFDTGRHREHTQRIVAYARAGGWPVAAVVNSHWHLDHVSGNRILRRAYPQAHVYASGAIDAALTGFLADGRARSARLLAEGKVPADQRAELLVGMATIAAGDELRPDRRVEHDEDIALAGRRVRLGLASTAVSAGDVWLFDPATRTLLAGDLVTLPAPLFDTACAEGWRRALEALGGVDFRVLVPGHGPPLSRAQFARYRIAFDDLLACAAGDAAAGTCIDGWLRDAGDLVAPGDRALARDLLEYYVGERLRAPAAVRDRDCQA